MTLNKAATENVIFPFDIWVRRPSTAHVLEWHNRFSEGRETVQGHE